MPQIYLAKTQMVNEKNKFKRTIGSCTRTKSCLKNIQNIPFWYENINKMF